MKRNPRWQFSMLALLGLIGASVAYAQEPAPPPKADAPPTRTRNLVIPIGGSQLLGMSTAKAIANVYLSGEGVIRVAPSPENKTIIISGINAGTVLLRLTDTDGVKEEYEITVQLDVAYLKNILARSVKTANIDVIATPNRAVILTGWVARPEDVETVVRITQTVLGANAAGVINAMRVGGVQQVQLDVTVASVNRTEARRRGYNFAISGTSASFGSILGGLATLAGGGGGGGGAAIAIGGAAATPVAPPTGANLIFGIVPWRFNGLLQALRDEQIAKLLAEPKVVALSGRPARFLSGGQAAVLSAGGSIGGPGVDFRDVGTEVDFLPVVLGNGKIYLEVNPRFRAINQARGITTSFGFVPGFDEQSVRTAIEMEPGQTLAIGGLIQTTTQSAATRVPVLGDLPFVGGLFNTVFHSETEEELIILVTPHLVDAQDCNQAPKRLPGRETRSPDDYELFLEYILEAPRGQRTVFEGGRYKAAYKNDPSSKLFPCADPLEREGRGRCGANCAPGQPGPLPAGAYPAPTSGEMLPAPKVTPRNVEQVGPRIGSTSDLPAPTMGPMLPTPLSPTSRTTVGKASASGRLPMMPVPSDEPPQ